MILVDANLLLYAYVRNFPQHERARHWLDRVLAGPTKVGLPWPSLLAFVRLVTNPRVFERPASIPDAWQQVQDWLSAKSVWIPHPGDSHRVILGELIPLCDRSNLIPDAHLAALCLEHGLTLCSTDAGFRRFQQVHWHNPLLET